MEVGPGIQADVLGRTEEQKQEAREDQQQMDHPWSPNSSEIVPGSRRPDSGGGRGQLSLRSSASLSSLCDLTAEEDSTLYAVEAFRLLQGGGSPFRDGRGGFRYRQPVQKIDVFWSYSRHGPAWHHFCSLLLWYNGGPATLASFLVLAPLPLLPWPELTAHREIVGSLALFVAACALMATIMTWPSREKVFLDSACIPQDDAELKRSGILSLGHYLKGSQTLAILWDPTYFQRLWCVFEVAAYLKLKADGHKTNPLKVLPAMHGMLTAWLLCGFVVLTLLRHVKTAKMGTEERTPRVLVQEVIVGQAAICVAFALLGKPLRKHITALKAMHKQLADFSLSNARCFCCDNGHVDPDTKQALACDRQLIEQSVVEWFGQVDDFDSFAKEELQRHMETRFRLPYRYALVAALPNAWSAIGELTWMAASGHTQEALGLLLEECVTCTIVAPAFFQVMLWAVAVTAGHDGQRLQSRLLSTLLVLLMMSLIFVANSVAIYLLGNSGQLVTASISSLCYARVTRGSLRPCRRSRTVTPLQPES